MKSDRPPRVLLAEDDDALRELLQECLEQEGYLVIPLEDGYELTDYLALARKKDSRVPQPDAIVSDVCMPGKDALEALEEIRGEGFACPVVLISAYATAQTRARAFALGASLFFDKPVDIQVLVSAVAAVLSARQIGRGRRERLLIADDDAETRSWVRELLDREDAEIKEASNGWDLLSTLAEEDPFELVITDIRMPGPSGLQVVEMARTAGAGTPFLVITAFPDDAVRTAVEKMENLVLLDKPFDKAQFLTAMQRLLVTEPLRPAHTARPR